MTTYTDIDINSTFPELDINTIRNMIDRFRTLTDGITDYTMTTNAMSAVVISLNRSPSAVIN